MSRARLVPAFALAGLATLVAGTAAAQQRLPLHWYLTAGLSQPTGPTSDLLQGGGYAVGGGLAYTPQPGGPFSLRTEFNYADHKATHQLIDNGQQQTGYEVDDGHGTFTSLTVNAVYKVPIGGGARAYGIAGLGAYHSDVSLTQRVLVGGTYCDFYWGFCYPGVAAGDLVVASQATTKLGWNAGLGVEFPLAYGQAWFIEARFNRIEATKPIDYVPITVGFRF